jgi:CRISPR associated protein Cas1
MVSSSAEPLRPAVDRFVAVIFSEGLLRPENFTASDVSGCRMKKEPRRAFYRAYEEEAQHHRPMLARIAQDFAGAVRARAQGARVPAIPAPSAGSFGDG